MRYAYLVKQSADLLHSSTWYHDQELSYAELPQQMKKYGMS